MAFKGVPDLTTEEKLKRFLYISSYHGCFMTGNPDKHYSKHATDFIFQWAKTNPEAFFNLLSSANDDPLLVRRSSLFYLLVEALRSDIPATLKEDMKKTVFKLVKSDEEFFDFIRFFTTKQLKKTKVSTTLRKMILKFYQGKEALELAKTVMRRESYHGWQHKALFKLSHIKFNNIPSEFVGKYVLYGKDKLPENPDGACKQVVELLKKTHEVKKTEDPKIAASLIKELHLGVEHINAKVIKSEEVWLAAIPEMTTKEILQWLFVWHKWGLIKNGSAIQSKIIEVLSNADKVKKDNVHPLEVFIHLKFFERGGKPLDPKLIAHLHTKEIKDETLTKLTTPNEPKCKPVIQSINKCLMLSYNNVQPTAKKFLVTIDVTEKPETTCFHNKRITCFEAVHAFVRFLTRVEKHVTVAVFKDNQINFIDLSKSHSAVEKLQEHKATYILPNAPIEYAKNKKKPVDVFVNFMSCNWNSNIPQEIKDKTEKLSESLDKYSKKMKSPDTKLVKIFLGGKPTSGYEVNKNILSIVGLTDEVPRVLEAFCKGQFC